MMQINNLSKRFSTVDGEIIALDNLTFNVDDGDFVAVVGKSGSGKTTLLNMIGGLDIPDDGSVFLDGIDIVKLSQKETAALRRQKIGVIYQFYNLIPELNVSENITLPTELNGGEINDAWLSEILEIVGLNGRERAYPDTLSGGQQQRVAIARALFNRPSLILADEPTGNLDSENADDVLSLLKQMNTEFGTTVIVVTHSDSIAKQAKRIITLTDGKISSDGRQ